MGTKTETKVKEAVHYQIMYFVTLPWKGKIFNLNLQFVEGSMTAREVTCCLSTDVTESNIPDIGIGDIRDLIRDSLDHYLQDADKEVRDYILKKVVESDREEEDLREMDQRLYWIKPFSIKVSHITQYYHYVHMWLQRWEEAIKLN
ncbi:MAG: hypothetical protein GXP45_02505 [bacterium]|nr:hypothetical protein [bacterium]